MEQELFVSNAETHKFIIPLQMIWNPKEDITTYELSMCLPYFFRSIMPYEVDFEQSYLRHFKIINHNK